MTNEELVEEVIYLYKKLPQKFQEEVQTKLGFYRPAQPTGEERFFKIMHKPSGLFYQTLKHNGSNVSTMGKTYEKLHYAKSSFDPEKNKKFRIIVSKSSGAKKILESLGYKFEERKWSYNQFAIDVPASEIEIVKV